METESQSSRFCDSRRSFPTSQASTRPSYTADSSVNSDPSDDQM